MIDRPPSTVGATWLLRVLNGTTLAWLMALVSLLTAFAAWVGGNATRDAGAAQLARHAAEYELSVDKQFVDVRQRLDQLDRDREARRVLVDTQREAGEKALGGRLDDVNRLLAARWEQRTEAINALTQRVGTLETKLCLIARVPLAGCR